MDLRSSLWTPLRKTVGTFLGVLGVLFIMVLCGWNNYYIYHGVRYWWSWPAFILFEIVLILGGLGLILGWRTLKKLVKRVTK